LLRNLHLIGSITVKTMNITITSPTLTRAELECRVCGARARSYPTPENETAHGEAIDRLETARGPARAKLRAALAKVNGRANAHTIATWRVREIADRAELMLEGAGIHCCRLPCQCLSIPRRLRVGTRVQYTPAGPSANAYKYPAISTTIELVRRSTGWRLISIERAEIYPRGAEQFVVTISPAARDAVIGKALRPFAVAA
jgi:hypothetical protein